ncbi:MAG: phosphatidylglycerol lysyltransferase domain-containing protein [Prevotellaceae bacterium]|jgi:hypothetical protein|nr:phosphatidylglycerol lysyltransferase domain-containing protein [Prevotellaceae bacterium]
MLPFHKISLDDRDEINRRLALSDFRAAEYSFANSFNWGLAFGIEIAYFDRFLLLRSGDNPKYYLYPPGAGDVRTAIQAILDDASEGDYTACIRAILPEQKAEMEQWFPNRFRFTPQRHSFDYIYHSEDLMRLAGKKYQAKRNHAARFRKTFDWAYEPVTGANLSECVAMNKEWCRLYGCNDNLSLKAETCAVQRALLYFFEEELLGGLLRVDGRVIAYTVGERLNSDTLIVHIEKAFSESFPGAYQVINQEFVQRHADGLAYVNREDDTGDAGLRKAKLSYHPAFLLEKYLAEPLP